MTLPAAIDRVERKHRGITLAKRKRVVNPGIYGGGGDGRAVGRSAR